MEKTVLEELDDSIFENYQKQIKEQDEKRSSGNFTQYEYDDIAYVGTDSGQNVIVRLLGAPPGSEKQTGRPRRDHDPIKFIASTLKDKEGNQFKLRLPLHGDLANKDHIVHRLYAKVTESDWVKDPVTKKSKKIAKYELKYPDLYEAVTHTGYDQSKDANGYKYCKGLKGQEVVAFNVIDRQDNWCGEHKHSKVLCKNLNITDDGKVFADEGIPAYGFESKLASMLAKYGNYEKYDVAIKRTGQKESPFELYNASKCKEKDSMEDLTNDSGDRPDVSIITVGPLTNEERQFEMYNLTKLKGPSTYNKIEKKIGWVFKLCDVCLGTKFYDELVGLKEIEAEEFKKLLERNESTQEAVENETIRKEIDKTEEQPTRRSRTSVGDVRTLSDDKIAILKGWSKLAPEQRMLIEEVKTDASGAFKEIIWKQTEETKHLLACDECKTPAPDSFKDCPFCGASFV